MAINLMTGLRKRVSMTGDEAMNEAVETRALDWHGLHARCTAAHAARRMLASAERSTARRTGGFGEWETQTPFPHQATPDVNPIDLAVLKLTAGKSDGVAQIALLSGRG
ncbi:MAG: hypothetical protein KGM49_08200 [Sphingomonadales bacterium]|nr:hypothetical protein [Sphingomonadales bacterium]